MNDKKKTTLQFVLKYKKKKECPWEVLCVLNLYWLLNFYVSVGFLRTCVCMHVVENNKLFCAYFTLKKHIPGQVVELHLGTEKLVIQQVFIGANS